MSLLTIMSLYRTFSPYAPFACFYVGAMIFWPVWQGWQNDYQASVYVVWQWLAVPWQRGDRLTTWLSNLGDGVHANQCLELCDTFQVPHTDMAAWHQEFY